MFNNKSTEIAGVEKDERVEIGEKKRRYEIMVNAERDQKGEGDLVWMSFVTCMRYLRWGHCFKV